MDMVRRAIEMGELTPAEIDYIREAIRSVRRELGLPVRGDADPGPRRRDP